MNRREFIEVVSASALSVAMPSLAAERKEGVWCYMLKLGTNMWCDCVSPKSGNLKPKG